MNNLLKLGKKIFTVGVASTTIFWSLGVAALVPAVAVAATQVDCATVVAGDFVKANGADIWVVNADKTKSYFPHGDTYKSWTADGKYTFKWVTGDCLASFPAAGIVAPRPGAYLLKDNATEKLFVTLAGGKLAEVSASAAAGLYGASYASTPAKGGRTIPATSPDMVLYTKSLGAVKVTEAAPTEGSLVSNGGKFYVVGAAKSLREVSDTGFTANKFQSKLAVALASTSGFTMATNAVSAMEAGLSDSTFGFKAAPGTVVPPAPASTSTPATSGTANVSLASDSPAAVGIPQDATGVDFMHFNVSGTGTLNDLKLHRIGLGAYDDLASVYIYDGNTRLTSGRTVSSDKNEVTFSNLKIALSSSPKTLRVVADLHTTNAVSGDADGFEVVSANGVAVSGVVGAVMNIGASSVSAVTVDNSGSTGSFALGASKVEVARGTISASSATNDVKVVSMTLTNAGTLSNDYIANLKLTLGSSDVATAATMNGDKAIFTLATPYSITKGDTKTFVVYADNTGGRVADNVKFYVDETSDVRVLDSQYNAGVNLTNSFSSGDQTYTITGGDLTLSNNGPAAANIGKNVTNVVLQKFSFSASNNVTVKSTKLNIFLVDSVSNALSTSTNYAFIKNVKIVDLDNGNQTVVGPQADFGTGTTASSTPTANFYKVFTDSYDVAAGKTRHFAVLADIDSSMPASYKITTKIDLSGANYVKYVDNSQYVSSSVIVPNTLTGNQMTVAGAQLTVTRATPPASASVVKGSTQNALGLLLTAGTSDDLKITSLKLRVFASTTAISNDLGDTAANAVVNTVSLWEDGATTPLATKNLSDLSGTIGTDGYYYVTFSSLNYKLKAGDSKKLVAQLVLKDSLTATRYVNVDIDPDDDIDVETFADGKSVTENSTSAINASSPVYLTVTTGGSVTVAVDGSTPLADVVMSGSASAVAMTTYKLTPTKENFTLVGAALKASTGHYVDVKKVVVTYKNKAGETVNKECFLNSSDECTFSDGQLDAYLVKDQSNLITLSAYFNTINDGATSGDAVKVGFKKASAQFSTSANLTNDFILLGEGSNSKQYGVTDSIALVDSTVNAKTVRKTNVSVAESDAQSNVHSTKAQDTVGVFTFTSASESGSNQNSTLGTLSVKLTGNLIAGSAVGNDTLAIYAYNGSTFDSAHLMNSTPTYVSGVATSTSSQVDIRLDQFNEWSGAKQVYLVVDTTDADFSDTSSNVEKLTAQLVTFNWGDGSTLNIAPVTGVPIYSKTYQY